MNFNTFSNRSQNYGNVKASGRNELIAQSRAKRKQRQKRKKHENGASIIQNWFRMKRSYRETMDECKHEFDKKVTWMLQNEKKDAFNSDHLNHLLYLFRVSLFGFVHNPMKWSQLLDAQCDSINTKWFTISLRRVYSIFLQNTKTCTKSQHFISQIITKPNRAQQMSQFQFLCIVFTKYLALKVECGDIKEQESIIVCLWTMVDCNKWKHVEKQSECQLFCYRLLQFLFTQTPFLSLATAIFTRYMKLTPTSADAKGIDGAKTILALLHTIIIRYFQFYKRLRNVDHEHKMDIDGTKESAHPHVVSLICIHVLSIPFYGEKLNKYSLQSVIKSFISKPIWSEIMTQFESYCIGLYQCFQENKKKTKSTLWQKAIPIHFAPPQSDALINADVDVMDIPDADDSDEEMNDIHHSKAKRKKASVLITELPAIAWTAHNLLHLLCVEKQLTSTVDTKSFLSFLNLSQIVFKLLDLVYPAAFPYNNPKYKYDDAYVSLFDAWCSSELLSAISSLIATSNSNATHLSLSDYSTITKYLLQIIAHFPRDREHHIWSHLSVIPTEKESESNRNLIVVLYQRVFCEYNLWRRKDWEAIMAQWLNGLHALTYFINKKTKQRKKRMDEYNSNMSQLQEATKCMEIFELFLFGLNHELGIIDDHQFHEYHIPFTPAIWTEFIETFKYIVFVKYWKHYQTFTKLKSCFKRCTRHDTPLSTIHCLQKSCDTLDRFVSLISRVFAGLRDRNTRKAFVNDDSIWLMDQYIDLSQFESEILNLSPQRKVDVGLAAAEERKEDVAQYHDPFNPFTNREFGYNEMFGGSIANNHHNNNNNHNQNNESQENLRRFEDNFNQIYDDDEDRDGKKYKRSFFILTEIPFVIPFKLRVKLFYALIEFEKNKLESSGNSIGINRGNAIRARIRRDNILDDGYRGLNQYASELKTLIQIEFENQYGEMEAGIDGGGIFKEFLNALIRDAFDPQRGLFLETETTHEIYPNPNYAVFKEMLRVDKDYYLFLGKMVGKALYDSVLIEPIFSQFFLRKLLSQHNYVDDLQSFDIDVYKQLMSLKHDYVNKNEIETMEISFSVTQDVLGSKRSYDLIPNGADILVNHHNKHQYIQLFADYKLNKSMESQSLSFLKGLSKVINVDYLRIFDATELSKLLSGDTQQHNWSHAWKDLRENTVYSGGFHNHHRCIKWFWEILNEDLTVDDNQKLLMFVTSCTRSPLLGFKSLTPNFSIMCTGGDTTNLPTSQTCMNLLKLPNFTTKQLLKRKLLQSIRSNAGFDLS